MTTFLEKTINWRNKNLYVALTNGAIVVLLLLVFKWNFGDLYLIYLVETFFISIFSFMRILKIDNGISYKKDGFIVKFISLLPLPVFFVAVAIHFKVSLSMRDIYLLIPISLLLYSHISIYTKEVKFKNISNEATYIKAKASARVFFLALYTLMCAALYQINNTLASIVFICFQTVTNLFCQMAADILNVKEAKNQ